jgi:hypothetical protein
MHAPTALKNDCFYGELKQMFDHFPKYHTKFLFGDVNEKNWGERIFSNRQVEMSVHMKIVMANKNV